MRPSMALLIGILPAATNPLQGQHVWQSDLQIKSLTVSVSEGHLIARFVVSAELGEAMAARVEVMLPPGVGIIEMGPGCKPGPNPPGMSELRARVLCSLGTMPTRTSRELFVTTTQPPPGRSRGFGVIAMSDTPDPKPGNNFAEKEVP
jgi:hypothetical protein